MSTPNAELVAETAPFVLLRAILTGDALDDADRLAVLELLTDGVCRDCGRLAGPDETCHCTNDE